MTTYNTGNALGSVDVRDLYDNAQNLDDFSNGPLNFYTDRLGVSRQSLQGMQNEFTEDQVARAAAYLAFIQASGYEVLGVYGAGLNFTSYNQVFSYLGEFYAPSAGLALPYTTTGAGAGEITQFRSVGDAVLRSDLAASGGGDIVGFVASGLGAAISTVTGALRNADAFNAKNFGALGDGTGATPTSTGRDILSESWNTWDGTPFKENLSWSPYSDGVTFSPPRAKPFDNGDTWDYIGISLCVWAAGKAGNGATYIPSGKYLINMGGVTRGDFTGLLIMKGQEQTIYGDGPYATYITTKEDAAFFDSNQFGVVGAYELLSLYRTGGPPTNLHGISLVGPNAYNSEAKNLNLIDAQNINGVMIRDMWFSAAWRGISAVISSSDSHISRSTFEFCFGDSVYTDETSELSLNFCNIWASASISGQNGVTALARTSVTSSRFIGFNGHACRSATGVFNGNLVYPGTSLSQVLFSDTCVITGNQIQGSTFDATVVVVKNATVTGNSITNTGGHACLNLGSLAAESATNITVQGNNFVTSGAVSAANKAITAEQSGVGYAGAATPSCMISNNIINSQGLAVIGAATMWLNIINGAPSPTFLASPTLSGDATISKQNGGRVLFYDLSVSSAGTQVITLPETIDGVGGLVVVGGVLQNVGGRTGMYVIGGNGNLVTTVAAISEITVTSNSAAGTITFTSTSAELFVCRVKVLL